MFNSIKHFEDAKKEKAVDDPRVRWKDPACWKCLSDEQRDVIHEWHLQRLIEKEQERQTENAKNTWAAILGLSPFVFFHALKRSDSFLLGFLLEAAAALVVFSVIFFLFAGGYLSARKAKPLTMDKLSSFFFHALALLVSFFVTCCVFSRIT